MPSSEVLQRTRDKAKNDLMRGVWGVTKELDATSEAIKEHVREAKRGDISETELVEGVLQTVFGSVERMDLSGLCQRLVIFHLSNEHLLKAMASTAKRFGLLEEAS